MIVDLITDQKDIMETLQYAPDFSGLQKKNPSPGTEFKMFTPKDVSHIPTIAFPGAGRKERSFFQRMSREVMYQSAINNGFDEVTVVYGTEASVLTTDDDGKRMVQVKYGTENKNCLLIDEGIVDILDLSSPATVYVLFNHPKNNTFYIDELALFIDRPSIQSMAVIKTSGEMDILYKQDRILDLSKDLDQCVVSICRHFGEEKHLKDFVELTDDERILSGELACRNLQGFGFTYLQGINHLNWTYFGTNLL